MCFLGYFIYFSQILNFEFFNFLGAPGHSGIAGTHMGHQHEIFGRW